ncbi:MULTISPECIES: hypothetical protein [Thalassospira]|jgi:hypothetical protein|uniref:DUF7660 family protein n=1 Tax=Thalassospira TaxID=168934 RepID=UPI001B2EC9CA|nr:MULTISPECIES: hypothetical protein [Thalassospira]MBO6808647.1 hypothetical protein [Thalassospira sp.]MBO6839655.1 hypothetical protein [Thalassospira sp.]MBS8274573.1 hypothetical protein [Thalassospira tepidiphila]
MNEEALIGMLANVETKGDFLQFLTLAVKDFEKNKDEWENQTISSFLEAMSAWVRDMEGHFRNNGQEVPNIKDWKFFAEAIYAARIYE